MCSLKKNSAWVSEFGLLLQLDIIIIIIIN